MYSADNFPSSISGNYDTSVDFSKLQVVFVSSFFCLNIPFKIKSSCQISLLKDFQSILESSRFKKIDAIFIDLDSLWEQALLFLKSRPYQKILNNIPIIVFSQNSDANLEEFIKNGINEYYVGSLNSELFVLRFNNFIKLHCLQSPDSYDQSGEQVELAFMAYYDKLTSLPNRQLFQERVENKIRASTFEPLNFAVFFLDLDGFKLINDLNSHEAGDWLLSQVAVRLKNCLKKHDTVARLGGDEFAILVEGACNHTVIEKIAHRILARLSMPYSYNDIYLKVNVSVGVSLFPENGKAYHTLMSQADQAMYKAKKAGKGQFALASN
jgi:diguanylate cyclase (GGDEF)-like protein